MGSTEPKMTFQCPAFSSQKAPPGFEPGAAALQVQRSTTEL